MRNILPCDFGNYDTPIIVYEKDDNVFYVELKSTLDTLPDILVRGKVHLHGVDVHTDISFTIVDSRFCIGNTSSSLMQDELSAILERLFTEVVLNVCMQTMP